jgi:outer membrane protein assembly factor BamE (lipoprotein component of BamABCDE complex)
MTSVKGEKRMLSKLVQNTILAIVALCVAAFLAAYHVSEGHGASLSNLGQIRPGMTPAKVISILGRPSTINRHSDGAESWYYTRGTFCQVKVHLTPVGRVRETDHDH